MKIKLEFDSWEELQAFKGADHVAAPAIHLTVQDAPETPQEEPKAEPEVIPAEPEKPAEEAKPEKPADDKPKGAEKDRVKVRKMLADINKKAGHNRAAELIKETTSADKLTNVSLQELPALMAKAQEELNNAQ